MKILTIPPVLLPVLLTFFLLQPCSVTALESLTEEVVPETVVLSAGAGDLTETEWRLTDPSGQSYGLHRYRLVDRPATARLFYLPGTNMNGTLKPGNQRHNLWLYLAERGVEIFALDYRTRFVPHDASGDLSFMRDWTMDLFVADAENAVNLIQDLPGDLPLFIAGFSRGASYAYALSGRQAFSGLIALDGGFKALPYKPFDLGGALRQFDADARYADPLSRRGYDRRAQMMQDVIDDPAGPSLDPRFENAAEYLAETLYLAWGPGVLSNTRSAVSEIQVLANEMLGYDWFFPTIQNVERLSLRSQEDDPRSPLDDHFGSMELPILYIGTGGFGADVLIAGIHSAGNSGSEDVTIHVLEGYGHLDVLFAQEAPEQVYRVIHEWIKQRTVDSP